MIFNHTVWGSIANSPTDGYTKLHFYRHNLNEYVSKTYNVTDGTYQFNLGDYDLLDINDKIYSGDVVLIEYYDALDNKLYSGSLILNLDTSIQRFDLDLNSYIENNDTADFSISEKVIKTTDHSINESSTSLYNYFKIEDLDNGEIFENNKNEFKFIPRDSNDYLLLQRALNSTNNSITEKSYQFKAIVSSATITRSNKCKGINDSIKILFLGYDTHTPQIEVIQSDSSYESGVMADEGSNLWSYNFVFPAEGHYCFRIDYGSESFITNFRVNKNNFKVYYLDESLQSGLSINPEYFYINDLDTSLGTLSFNDIGNGLYGSTELDVQYGDYLFDFGDEEFISSFEECSSAVESSGTTKESIEEEVYWIFPNNIGD